MKQLGLYRWIKVIVLLLMSNSAIAQQIVVDETTDPVAGAPIFQHAAGYAGMVVYDGEEIPWVVLSDVYVFNKLVFKNERQAKKYYKIAANIQKV